MGRKPTVNLNLPPRMRARPRGKRLTVHYYYDWGGKPRREEALGSNFLLAVKRWSEIEQAQVPKGTHPTFKDAADSYVTEVLPAKARRTQIDNLKELTLPPFDEPHSWVNYAASPL